MCSASVAAGVPLLNSAKNRDFRGKKILFLMTKHCDIAEIDLKKIGRVAKFGIVFNSKKGSRMIVILEFLGCLKHGLGMHQKNAI